MLKRAARWVGVGLFTLGVVLVGRALTVESRQITAPAAPPLPQSFDGAAACERLGEAIRIKTTPDAGPVEYERLRGLIERHSAVDVMG